MKPPLPHTGMPHADTSRIAHDRRDPDLEQDWRRRQALVLIVSAIAMLYVFEATRLDLWLARFAFDADLGRFALRTDPFLENVMHRGAKTVLIGLALAAVGLCVQGLRGRLAWLPPRGALTAVLGMLLIPAVTSILKALTNRHCPWDVVDFGGYAPYLGLLALPDAGLKRGVCFPAGHASVGYLWLVWGVALRTADVRYARAATLVAILLGSILGAAQMLRGAHFLSHTLWSMWLGWAISLALACALDPLTKGRNQAARGKLSTARTPPMAEASKATAPP